MAIRAIVTGVTGMVGEGVVHQCLNHPEVESVLVVGRRTCNIHHPKLREIIHSDFFDFSAIEDQLSGYNACYFCLGTSSIGMKEEDFRHITYELTLTFAQSLAKKNKDMTFCYVSGAGTDSTEKGRSMWARVKGRTENDLLKLPFKQAFMFRPGYIHPTKGLKNTKKAYVFVKPFYPIWKALFPGFVSSLRELGLAMINVTINGYDQVILHSRDIVKAAKP